MKVTIVTGGVGGAKFVLGMKACGLAKDTTAIINTGDDFRHLGLHVSPDIDTVLYTLSGKDNKVQGWGREGETWSFMDAVRSLGGPDWFKLGDGDLALHVLRSEMLASGATLSQITAQFAAAWNVGINVLPMSDDPVATLLDTDAGQLAFQHYFVKQQCKPVVRGVRFEGAARAKPAPGVIDAILNADAVFVAPSNPYLSVDPVLAVKEIAVALRQTCAPVVVISPLIGGKAVKGPTAKIMAELGIPTSNDAIASHYASFADGMLYDSGDEGPAKLPSYTTQTLMLTLEDKIRVAKAAVQLCTTLG